MPSGRYRERSSFASGVVADWFSPLFAVAALGGTFLVIGLALFAWRPPVEKEDTTGVSQSAAAE